MELGDLLVSAAVRDQPIACLLKSQLACQLTGAAEQVLQEFPVVRADGAQVCDRTLGYDQDVYRVGRLRMTERDQRVRLTQTVDWYQKAHSGENPGDQPAGGPGAG